MVLFVSSLQARCYEYGSLCSSSPYLYYILIFLIDPVVFNLNVFEFVHLVRYMSWEFSYMIVCYLGFLRPLVLYSESVTHIFKLKSGFL